MEDFATLVMLYLTRIAFWLLAGVLAWWTLDNQYGLARFMVTGAIVGATIATLELTRER